jgi:hypothetical protein
MDLLSIARTLWRHKLLTLPVILVTMVGAAYVLVLSKPTYQTTADYALSFPPNAPAPSAIANDPGLAKISPDNPYARFTDQAVVVAILASALQSDSIRQSLVAKGADSRFTVAPSAKFGMSTPIAEVTSVGPTAAIATNTGRLVAETLQTQLADMQKAQGVNPYYMVRLIQIDTTGPRVKVSSKLRSLLAVIGLGTFLVFVVVSVGDAIDKKRAEKAGRGRPTSDDQVSTPAPAPVPVPYLTPAVAEQRGEANVTHLRPGIGFPARSGPGPVPSGISMRPPISEEEQTAVALPGSSAVPQMPSSLRLTQSRLPRPHFPPPPKED